MHGVKETEKRQTGEKGGMISQILLFVCTGQTLTWVPSPVCAGRPRWKDQKLASSSLCFFDIRSQNGLSDCPRTVRVELLFGSKQDLR